MLLLFYRLFQGCLRLLRRCLRAGIAICCAAVIGRQDIRKVRSFYHACQDFRPLARGSAETGLGLLKCFMIKEYLYNRRELGLYYFEGKKPPQVYMRRLILETFPEITPHSFLLEILKPGRSPLFSYLEYPHWYAVDKYLDNGVIKFGGASWAHGMYPGGRIFKAGWENLRGCSPVWR